MHDKTKTWSDGQGESRASAEDMMEALGDQEDVKVKATPCANGVILMGNCHHCGRQWKMLSPWAEVAMMFVGQVPNGPNGEPPWKPTRQGIFMRTDCACGKKSPMVTEWDEIRAWVDIGIRIGALSPKILQAVRG